MPRLIHEGQSVTIREHTPDVVKMQLYRTGNGYVLGSKNLTKILHAQCPSLTDLIHLIPKKISDHFNSQYCKDVTVKFFEHDGAKLHYTVNQELPQQ